MSNQPETIILDLKKIKNVIRHYREAYVRLETSWGGQVSSSQQGFLRSSAWTIFHNAYDEAKELLGEIPVLEEMEKPNNERT